MRQTVVRLIKLISIPVLLVASLFAPYAGNYELPVNLVFCLGAVVGVRRAIQLKNYFWAAGLAAIAIVFSPYLLAAKLFLLMSLTSIATGATLVAALRSTRP